MPIDLLALVATGTSTFVASKLSDHFASSKLKQHFEDAASHAVSRCEERFPARTSEWDEFVSFLNTPVKVEQLVETLLYERALPECKPWCQPLLEDFLLRLSAGLLGTAPAKERGGFLGLSIQLMLVERRLNSRISAEGAAPLTPERPGRIS